MAYKTKAAGVNVDDIDSIFDALAKRTKQDSREDVKLHREDAKASHKGAQSTTEVSGNDISFQMEREREVPEKHKPVQAATHHAKQQVVHRDLEETKNVSSKMRQADGAKVPEKKIRQETRIDPAIPQATPVTGHFNIVCLTAKGYNRLIDLLLKEANHYDKLGDAGREIVKVMENMVYTFSKSSSRFTDLHGEPEVLLTLMDEDITNVLGILLKAAYTGHPDPKVDYSASLPYSGT